MKTFKRRLAQYVSISDEVWGVFESLDGQVRTFSEDEDIIRAGDKTKSLFIIQSGWAIRFRMLEDGRRQIVNFMLPGDMFDLQALADLDADHSVSTVTACEVIMIDSSRFVTALRGSPDIAAAFWWAAVQEESILREQIVRIGRRSARERIGHLLLELHRRLSGALGDEVSDLPLPVTRTEIADALGLTPVHVSRTMSAMRRAGWIEESPGRINIIDREKMAAMAHYDTGYLHLRKLDFSKYGALESE